MERRIASSRGWSSCWSRVPLISRLFPLLPDLVDMGDIADLASNLRSQIGFHVVGATFEL